jgi:hypothetical protein
MEIESALVVVRSSRNRRRQTARDQRRAVVALSLKGQRPEGQQERNRAALARLGRAEIGLIAKPDEIRR